MAAPLLETPSRIWRRIEAIEGEDMPSLPSVPGFDQSAESSDDSQSKSHIINLSGSAPIHSTPTTVSSHTTTIHTASRANSTERFATSIASRSTKSVTSNTRTASKKHHHPDSFDISVIPSLPDIHHNGIEEYTDAAGLGLPPHDDSADEDICPPDPFQRTLSSSLASARDDVDTTTPHKSYDHSVNLRSEPKPSSFNKFRNVSYRRPLARTRTPSLSRTTPSPDSSSTNSTPRSSHSVLIPPDVPLADPADGGEISESEEDGHSFHQTLNYDQSFLQDSLGHPDSDHAHLSYRDSREIHDGENGGASHDDQEPTFSDEPMSSSGNIADHQSPGPLTSASSMFTPTPAFQSRPRARFDVPVLQTPSQTEGPPIDSDIATPFARRRSFLLSVINSENRPRPRFTPHPRRSDYQDKTITSDEQSTPGQNLMTAFAGVTPRPITQGRPSHPLAQTHLASPDTPISATPSPHNSGTGNVKRLPRWSLSPVEDDRASFVSTASSHDLTTHHRVNTSFDPVMGLGAQGHGVGRFNAGKLNSYLHGLNRRLQEENETLIRRLNQIEASVPAGGRMSLVPESRRVSVGSALGDVEEDVSGEGWVEEKAELEKMVDAFREEVQNCIAERETLESALEGERQERARDKERWKERMAEVENGVEGIISDLECRIANAEQQANDVKTERDTVVRDLQKRLAESQAERDVALERVQRAEQMLEGRRGLSQELRDANDRVGKLMADLRNANQQIKDLEEDALRSDERVEQVEAELEKAKQLRKTLDKERQTVSDELYKAQHDLKSLEERLAHAELESREAQTYAEALEEEAGISVERIHSLETQLSDAQSKIKTINSSQLQAIEKSKKLEAELQRNAGLNKQIEDALEAAEQKMSADEEQIADLRARLSALQRQQEQALRSQKIAPSPTRNQGGPTEEELEELEEELEKANREIGRLTMLLQQSPARKAIDKAKDSKIELLETERGELLERIHALKATMTDVGTPGKLLNTSTLSPMHRQALSISMRAPRTPGGPLRDISWLNDTVADPTVAPFLAEIARLQRDLDRANESIDDKLDKLGETGLGVVNLTKKLDDARSRIVALEEDIARLSRREDRRVRRLERARCRKCHGRVDIRGLNRAAEGDESSVEVSQSQIPPDPPTPPTRTSEALRADLQSAISQLDRLKEKWKQEKQQLLGQKVALQDAAKKLDAEVRSARDEVKRVVERERTGLQKKAGIQGELESAKNAIVELETELKAERARLRSFTTEQQRVQLEKQEILLQMQRAETDMEDVKGQLQRLKRENLGLEQQLQVNTSLDRKARLLEAKVADNSQTIEQLRQERSLLMKDHKELQRRFTDISEQANRLRDEVSATQTAHDTRRHQLDLHVIEIEALRQALSTQADELQRTEAEKKRIATEKGDVARTVATLEADLARVRKDARNIGQDLKTLRIEKENLEAKRKEERANLERAKRHCETQIRQLSEQLEDEQERTSRAKADLRNHVCVLDEKGLSAMKLQHNKECKGLMVQIRYLKAKYTRETGFRCDLGYQKQYLLTLLSMFERSEQTVIAALARIGFPTRPPASARKGRSLKSIAISIVFILRAKRTRDLWQDQCKVRPDLAAALQEVRRRRITNS